MKAYTLDELAEKVTTVKNKIELEHGFEPDTVYIHPKMAEKCGLSDLKTICGLKVLIPSMNDLSSVAALCGVDPDTDKF